MATIKPFFCIRPSKGKAAEIAALPYDVYNRKEAKLEVEKNPLSFLSIDRGETTLPKDISMYDDRVYERANSLLTQWIEEGKFIQDEQESYYIYELTMNGRTQTGIVACASIDDYENNVIRKHENTRASKEEDRIRHVDRCNAQTGPIFLAYRAEEQIQKVVEEAKKQDPLYAFVSEDNILHRVFQITDENRIHTIEEAFLKMNHIYIADGHHRAASAVKVGLNRRKHAVNLTGNEPFNFFLSVLFPDSELMIMDYNRAVHDLNGYTESEFLEKVSKIFSVTELIEKERPNEKGKISMVLGKRWYSLTIPYHKQSKDPVKGLDVSLLADLLLEPVLGITDQKTSDRIDFIGGIRGLEELEKRVNEDCKVAFAMYPTSISELFAVSDAKELMPPKSTWFEPKLRSGLFIHKI